MRGFAYAPIVGVLLLGIAFIVMGYLHTAEKSLVGVVTSQNDRISYIGYAEISAPDILSSFIARLRSYVIEELNRRKATDAYRYFTTNFADWFSAVLRDLSQRYPGDVRIQQSSAFSGWVEEVSGDLLLAHIRGAPVRVVVSTPGGSLTLGIDLNSDFPLYYPLKKLKKAAELGDIDIGFWDLDLHDLRESVKEVVEEELPDELGDCEADVYITEGQKKRAIKITRHGLSEGDEVPMWVKPTVELRCRWEDPGLGEKEISLYQDLETIHIFDDNIVQVGDYFFPVSGAALDDVNSIAVFILKHVCGCDRNMDYPTQWGCYVDNDHERKKEACEELCDFMGYSCDFQ